MGEPILIRNFGYSLPVHWSWVVVSCALIGLLVVYFYWRERGQSSTPIRTVLAVFRISLCWMAILAMLNWHVTVKKFQRSELIICFDNSLSLNHLDKLDDSNGALLSQLLDAGFDRPSRINVLKWRFAEIGTDWLESLKSGYSIRSYSFGESENSMDDEPVEKIVEDLELMGQETRIDHFLHRMLKRQNHSKPAAIVLFSDGLDSDDPQFRKTRQLASSLGIPVFPIALGEKEPAKDLEVVDVQANPKVFLNDLVEFRVSIAVNGFAKKNVQLQLIDEEAQEIIAEKEVSVSTNRFRDLIRFRKRMTRKGSRHLTARLLPLAEEFDTSNNQRVVEIEIDDTPIKVLLAANYPGREFHFLKQFLGREAKPHPDTPSEFANNRIELDTFLQQADIEYAAVDRHAIKIFPVTRKQLFEYDVVIFCDLKPNWAGTTAGGLGSNELEHLKEFVEERGGGLIFVPGPKFTPHAYRTSSIASLFPLRLDSIVNPKSNSEVAGVLDQPFSSRRTPYGKRFLPMELGGDAEAKNYTDFPGTYWFASSSSIKPTAVILAELLFEGKRIPGIVMQKVGAGTVLYHSFPETYRWRYRTSEVYFGRYWSQMIQFLASSKLAAGGQDVFLETDRAEYFRGEQVQVLGVLLDRSTLRKNNLALTVKNQSGFEINSTLKPADDAPEFYSTTLSQLSPGSYEAFLVDNPQVQARFKVLDQSREDDRQPVNEAGLKKLAEDTGGKYLKISELENLLDSLPEKKLIEMGGHPPWIFWNHWEFVCGFGAVFLCLITLEWIIRKRVAML